VVPGLMAMLVADSRGFSSLIGTATVAKSWPFGL
jgi:hypothetical protein